MFFLMWFLYSNNAVDVYQLGIFETMKLCESQKAAAMVLITNSKTRIICLEVLIDD
tara:strand:- start:46 stop:213 length:168 start_codon:yes stop_codon:yes gene_type:complete